MGLIAIYAVIFAVICLIYFTHVLLIKKKNMALNAFASVDVQLKKRYDLIPNLVSIAKGYMKYESGIFEKITLLRMQAVNLSNDSRNIYNKIKINSEISDILGKILVSAESYPELKSSEVMINLMRTLTDVEEHIAAARRFYNSAVNELNNDSFYYLLCYYNRYFKLSKKYKMYLKRNIMPYVINSIGDIESPEAYESIISDETIKKSGLFMPYDSRMDDDKFKGYTTELDLKLLKQIWLFQDADTPVNRFLKV